MSAELPPPHQPLSPQILALLDVPAPQLPLDDRLLHRLLIRIARFRAWALGGVFTAGALAAVFSADGSLLLVRPRYRSGWGLPGGFMTADEQPLQALQRELDEEVGLPDHAQIFGPLVVYKQPGRRHIDHLYVVLVETTFRLRTRVPAELAEAAWYKSPDLPELQPEAHVALNWLRDNY